MYFVVQVEPRSCMLCRRLKRGCPSAVLHDAAMQFALALHRQRPAGQGKACPGVTDSFQLEVAINRPPLAANCNACTTAMHFSKLLAFLQQLPPTSSAKAAGSVSDDSALSRRQGANTYHRWVGLQLCAQRRFRKLGCLGDSSSWST